jgi:LytS/YehU family sensor histidine kinase
MLSYFFIAYFPSLLFPIDWQNMPKPQMGFPGKMPPRNFIRPMEGDSIIQFLLIFAMSFLIKINNQLTDIQSEKLKAEVSYLKAQINPHFLFNTLNSLYSLTISKSDDAPDAVLKLSNIMRYVVTESTNDFVPLDKELNYIKDYIDLQKLRIADNNYLNISISGDAKGKKIAPLVIIPFIENAFKYGINSEEDWKISIKIDIAENEFLMIVENNIVNVNLPENYASEQGIENSERRLDFIYPGSHELTVTETKEIFKVNLKINLE